MAEKKELLSDLGEFGCIRHISHDLIYRPELVRIGPGDDGAVYICPEGSDEVISTDTMVEGIHFTAQTLSAADVGYKLCTANFSDMAAMGAEPTGFVISAALPEKLPIEWLDRCYDGIRMMCRRYRVNILGGDMTGSRQGVVLTGTVIGAVPKKQAVARGGAQPGDWIGVTGSLGDSAAGLAAIMGELEGYPGIREVHRRPEPQVEAGRLLRCARVSSMNDISDGLSGELEELAEASGQAMIIRREAVPLSEEVRRLAAELGKDPLIFALNGGEDYQLVFTISPEKWTSLALPVPVSVIGHVEERGRPGVWMSGPDGEEAIHRGSYDHFRQSV